RRADVDGPRVAQPGLRERSQPRDDALDALARHARLADEVAQRLDGEIDVELGPRLANRLPRLLVQPSHEAFETLAMGLERLEVARDDVQRPAELVRDARR